MTPRATILSLLLTAAAVLLAGCPRGSVDLDFTPPPLPRVAVYEFPLPDGWQVRSLSVSPQGWLVTTGRSPGHSFDGFRAACWSQGQLSVQPAVYSQTVGANVTDAVYMPRLDRVVFATPFQIAQWDPTQPEPPDEQGFKRALIGFDAARPRLALLSEQSVLIRAGSVFFRFNAKTGDHEAVQAPAGTTEMIDAGGRRRWVASRIGFPGRHDPGLYLFVEATHEERPIRTGPLYDHLTLASDGESILAAEAGGAVVRLDWRGDELSRLTPGMVRLPAPTTQPQDEPTSPRWNVQAISPLGRFVAGSWSPQPGVRHIAIVAMDGRTLLDMDAGRQFFAAWAPDAPVLYVVEQIDNDWVLRVAQVEEKSPVTPPAP
ncbi:MAG: hypothetical protein BIFFINMI_04047 [Phycisphaerae bacterium]|nr:hypothetical protein [Phycisphaerae bacterium]